MTLNGELLARDIEWTSAPVDELLLSDDDIRHDRTVLREALGIALELLRTRTLELARARERLRRSARQARQSGARRIQVRVGR